MKRITLLLFFIGTFVSFAQTPLDKIKTYSNANRTKLALQVQDIADLVIVNEFSSEAT